MQKHISPDIVNALKDLANGKGAPIIRIRNTAIDPFIWDHPIEKIDRNPPSYITEFNLKAWASLLESLKDTPESYNHHRYDTGKSRGKDFMHVDFGSTYTADNGSVSVLSKDRCDFSLLQCLQGASDVETAFGDLQKVPLLSTPKRDNPNLSFVKSERGDLILFDNRRVVHGRFDQEQTTQKRRIVGVFMKKPERAIYGTHEGGISLLCDLESVLSNSSLSQQIKRAAELAKNNGAKTGFNYSR